MLSHDRSPASPDATGERADLLTRIDHLVDDMKARLHSARQPDGHWVFELEADATIPAEYVLLYHFIGHELQPALRERLGRYLRAKQNDEGGWPLFFAGATDLSASVKAYYALKLLGDAPDAPHMARARAAIHALGGAAKANVFTRYTLALFGQIPWRGVPTMPVEVVLLPQWFPFHLSKVSYWSRTVMAPLLVLFALKPRASDVGAGIAELFLTPPQDERQYNVNPTGRVIGEAFLLLDKLIRPVERRMPQRLRERAIRAALDFIEPRLNGTDGLGAIYPAMANVVMMYHAMGVAHDDPRFTDALAAIDRFLQIGGEDIDYCQPCFSPIWDTSLIAHALMDAGEDGDSPTLKPALHWLKDKQILDKKGDWAWQRPDLPPGGWPFEYANDHYPDIDDTAVVAMALHRADDPELRHAVERAATWVLGMQSKNGGWGAFDVDNTAYYLNSIPFADHGALLDPPSADVTARCLGFLAQIGYGREHPAVRQALDYLYREQEDDGSWYGRWGANYVYGTWSVISALNATGEPHDSPVMRRAVAWLKAYQREDGGWGEALTTYEQAREREPAPFSTPSQTAWAVLALMTAGALDDPAVARGIGFLQDRAPETGLRWHEDYYTGVGFPRVFYLRYHGYAAYFPFWALARYRMLQRKNDRTVASGL